MITTKTTTTSTNWVKADVDMAYVILEQDNTVSSYANKFISWGDKSYSEESM